ncbi:MAG: DUF4198 domain-containing protein [Planctomycetaceae bacterium]|nr:DUF4198 domain-containing protein [Planctomycetaceae bacterium]
MITTITRPLIPVTFLLAGLSFAGCNSGLRTEYVEGIVTLEDKPLEGALVTFIPASGGTARVAAGTTDARGRFTLTTAEGGKAGRGTTEGDYKVTIAKRAPETTKQNQEIAAASANSGQPPTREEMAAADRERRTAGLPPPYLYLSPKKYNNPDTSGLTATVVKGKNKFGFSLTEK